jgi:hypothetical protein
MTADERAALAAELTDAYGIDAEYATELVAKMKEQAYYKSRGYPRDDYEQEMWLELITWLDTHGAEGTLEYGRKGRWQGQRLLDQPPTFVAFRMAGLASKHYLRAAYAAKVTDELDTATEVHAAPIAATDEDALLQRAASIGGVEVLDIKRALERMSAKDREAALLLLQEGSSTAAYKAGAAYRSAYRVGEPLATACQ